MRLIDADALLRELKEHYNKADGKKIYHPSMELAMHDVKNAPAIDAVPVVHGRWEKADNLKPKCSVCGKFHLHSWSDYKKCNYCPNCGAKMDLEVSE